MRYLLLCLLLVGCAGAETYQYRSNAQLCHIAVNGFTENIRGMARQELSNRQANCHNVNDMMPVAVPVPVAPANRAVTCQSMKGAAGTTTTCQ